MLDRFQLKMKFRKMNKKYNEVKDKVKIKKNEMKVK